MQPDMKKALFRFSIFIMLLSLCLASCVPARQTPEIIPDSSSPIPLVTTPGPSIPTHVLKRTITPLPSTPAVTPLPPTPTATQTDPLPLERILQYQPLVIAPELPENTHLEGSLILRRFGNPSYRLDFSNQHLKQDFPKDTFCFSTTPDGKLLAYCQGVVSINEPKWLIVENVAGEVLAKLAIEREWGVYDYLPWLDNQWLATNLVDQDGYSESVLVINPFSGVQQKLVTDYPDFRPSGMGPGGTWPDFVLSTAAYHPSLDLVVYPESTTEGPFITLWNRQSQQALARVTDLSVFRDYPLWAPDGDQFAVAVRPPHDNRTPHFVENEEWFRVGLDGGVEQLTNFNDFFRFTEIRLGAWSADSQYLAFWLETQPNLCDQQAGPFYSYLAVLEVKTRKVINYCIPTSFGNDPQPVWSPDGEYLAIQSDKDSSERVILVNIKQGWAVQIASDARPMGWLAPP